MNDYKLESLLSTIVDKPEEDTPRLMYADRLTELDQYPDLAKFIDLHIQFDRTRDRDYCSIPFSHPLVQELARLWDGKKMHAHNGVGALFDFGALQSRMDWEHRQHENDVCIVRRGFREQVNCSMTYYMANIPSELFKRNPITKIKFNGIKPQRMLLLNEETEYVWAYHPMPQMWLIDMTTMQRQRHIGEMRRSEIEYIRNGLSSFIFSQIYEEVAKQYPNNISRATVLHDSVVYFKSEQEAEDALSYSAVCLARRLCDLNPLTKEQVKL